jgi:hypothetical protein
MKVKIKRTVALSDSGFVFDASTGDSFTVNPVGQEILDHIKSGRSESEITGLITGKYEVEKDVFERYLCDFLGTLKQMQIIEDYA